MAIYSGECSDDLPEHNCTPCPTATDREFGRVRSAGFIFGDYLDEVMANPTLKTVWDAGILAGKIIVVPETAGSYDPGDPKVLKGYGDRIETYGPRTMTLSFNDPNLSDNYAHYNALGNQTELIPWFRTSSKLRIFDTAATITAKDPVADDIESEVVWEVTAKVISVNIPTFHEFTTLISTVFKCSYLNTLLSGLRFTTQPVNTTGADGATIIFTTVASGGTGSKTYQWEYSDDNGATWDVLAGKTAATLTINSATSANSGKYRNKVTDTTGTVISTVVTLTVTGATTFDTALTFGSSVSDSDAGINATAGATDSDLKFEFNAITSIIGTPSSMNIKLSSALVLVVDFPTDYNGASFKFTDAAGAVHTGVFAAGDVNF